LTSRIPRRPNSPSFPYTTLFRSRDRHDGTRGRRGRGADSRDRRGARRVNGTDAAWVVGRLTIGTLVRVFGRLRVYGRDRVPKTEIGKHTSELQSPDHLVCRLLLE